MGETHHIDGIRAVVGSQFCSGWWQFGGAIQNKTVNLYVIEIII
jgi:hypothetical protein